MSDNPSKRRLAENEVIFREANKSAHEFIKENGISNQKASYHCECSRVDCTKRIKMTLQEYEDEHNSERQFIILPGHANLGIEKVIKDKGEYQVVEKFINPPSPEEIDKALRDIKS